MEQGEWEMEITWYPNADAANYGDLRVVHWYKNNTLYVERAEIYKGGMARQFMKAKGPCCGIRPIPKELEQLLLDIAYARRTPK